MRILFIWQLSPYILHYMLLGYFCIEILELVSVCVCVCEGEYVVFIEEKEVCFCSRQEICVFLCGLERKR